MNECNEESPSAEEMVAQIEAIFDLRYACDMRAIKRWQAATGRDLTWPDHTDLLVWLLSELDKAEACVVEAAKEVRIGWDTWCKKATRVVELEGSLEVLRDEWCSEHCHGISEGHLDKCKAATTVLERAA